jgi:hypothetical protein
MKWTFYGATAFNQPLAWDTSQAKTHMEDMFKKAGDQAQIMIKNEFEPAKTDAGSSLADLKPTLQVDTYEGTLAEGQEQIVLPVPKARVGEYTVQVSWKADTPQKL